MNIVPFGKYRGQPIEAMAADHQYMEWLTAQPWFRERHQNIYTLIVNNFHEPSETPEHNKLQAHFLNNDFVLAFMDNLFGESRSSEDVAVRFEVSGFDIFIKTGIGFFPRRAAFVEIKPTNADEYPAVLRQMKAALQGKAFRYEAGFVYYTEGDRDYPIKSALYIGDYTGVGATLENVASIFKADGITILR